MMLRGLIFALTFVWALPALAAEMTVYKDPNCGGYGKWIEHMRAAGYTVIAKDTSRMGLIKRLAGIPDDMQSCHTAMIDGYAIEGHVPAREVDRLLAERPRARGLAVPGMPEGSPGMETGEVEPYEVLLLKRDGSSSRYARY